jgi:hypothetical protein
VQKWVNQSFNSDCRDKTAPAGEFKQLIVSPLKPWKHECHLNYGSLVKATPQKLQPL